MNTQISGLATLLVLGTIAVPLNLLAQAPTKNADENAAIRKEWDSWNAPFKPFRIIGNLYYVGPVGISSFLITTSEGSILLDTGFGEEPSHRLRHHS